MNMSAHTSEDDLSFMANTEARKYLLNIYDGDADNEPEEYLNICGDNQELKALLQSMI